jgi:hypothetical protein
MELIRKFVNFILPHIDTMLKKAINHEHTSDTIPNKYTAAMLLDAQIAKVMDGLLDSLKASRVQMYKYHNGGKTCDGLDYIKCSCTSEVVSRGVRPSIQYFQSSPVGMYADWNKRLMDNETVVMPDISKISTSSQVMFTLLSDHSVKSCVVQGVFDFNQILIGFIKIDYVDAIMDEAEFNLTNGLARIGGAANQITGLLFSPT